MVIITVKKYNLEIINTFLKKHHLLDKSNDEIDDYLDEHELSMPDPNKIILPSLAPGSKIDIRGKFDTPCVISLLGLVP